MNSTPVPARSSTSESGLPMVPWERVDHFIGQFTHDLRNGLNALELQLTLLSEMNQDPALAEDILAMRGTLGNLSRDMQTVRNAAGPVPTPNLIPYPAGDLLEDLRERQEKSVAGAFRWQLGPEVAGLTLEIDPELLLAALLQILGNAVRFRESENPVGTFSARAAQPKPGETGSGLVLELTEPKTAALPADTLSGWGAEPLHSTRRGGYGLGLFRARRVIEALGGTLRAEGTPAPQPALVTTIWLPATTDGATTAAH